MRKLAVGFPGDTPSVFMAAFHSAVNIEAPPDCEVKWFRGMGWCQARRRAHLCEQALDWGADLICQLDADQVYEPDVLKRLLNRIDEGCQVVAAMVPGRVHVNASMAVPFQRLAWKVVGEETIPVDPNDGDLQQAEFPTSACVMFRADVLKNIERPWYFNKFDAKDWSLKQGEDGVFFYHLKLCGIPSYVDTTIRVKHAHVFEIDESFPDRFADWSEG